MRPDPERDRRLLAEEVRRRHREARRKRKEERPLTRGAVIFALRDLLARSPKDLQP